MQVAAGSAAAAAAAPAAAAARLTCAALPQEEGGAAAAGGEDYEDEDEGEGVEPGTEALLVRRCARRAPPDASATVERCTVALASGPPRHATPPARATR
jgi:hypothetical protein